jgi:hypothetical protein
MGGFTDIADSRLPAASPSIILEHHAGRPDIPEGRFTKIAEAALAPRRLGAGRFRRFRNAHEFAGEVLSRYQAHTDEAHRIVRDLFAQGKISIPEGASEHLILGHRIDAIATSRLRRWLKEEGIREGRDGVIRVNRRLYSPDGKSYRRPDIHIPEASLILDGTTGQKWRTTPQIADFIRNSGHNVTIVRPRRLGDLYTYSIPAGDY